MRLVRRAVASAGFLALCLSAGCGSPSPSATATPSPAPSAAPTAKATLTPSPTASPTLTPSLTPTATLTPSPTATPLFVGQPEVIDLSGPEHAGRPRLSGTVRVIDTQHFRLFYTVSGDDAVPLTDRNGNAIPDYVETAGRTLEFAWQVLVDDLGWAAPPPDRSRGGNDLLDVYLMDLDFAIAGIAEGGEPETIVGDNPNTDALEFFAAYSFLRIDNDFAESEEWNLTTTAINFMRTTAVHEFMHAIQLGYDSSEPIGWIWEATATWAETIVLKTVTDMPMHLTASFKSPDTCLLSYGGFERYEDSLHWYSRWLFLSYISDTYGVEVIRMIWENFVLYDGYEAIDAALASAGTSLEQVIREYEVALLLRDFDFDLDYPTVRLEASLTAPEFYRPENGVGQLGADFMEIEAEGLVEVELRQVVDGMLIGVNADEADVYDFTDGLASVHAGQYEHVYLVVLNLNRAERWNDCSFQPYSVELSLGSVIAAPQRTVPVLDFSPPRVEPLFSID